MSKQDTATSTVAVITGGAGGMGLATARLLGRDHRVVLSDVGKSHVDEAIAQLQREGIAAEGMLCDVTDRQAVDATFARAATLGRIVSVVHTAGLSPLMADPATILRVNALGTLNVSEASLTHASEGMGHVNVASMAAHLQPSLLKPQRAYVTGAHDYDRLHRAVMRRLGLLPKAQRAGLAYGISKDFVVWHARAAAPTFGDKGARLVSVSPGTFATPMGKLEEASGAAKIVAFGSLPRLGRVEEIAEVLAFCASPKAGYLTATDILVDGGVVAGITWRDMLKLA